MASMVSPRDTGGANTPISAQTHSHHGPHIHVPGRRLRQIVMPHGRKIHVAHSPEEVDHHRRRKSSAVPLEKGEEDFDVVLHGSQEHMEALRECHGHHERARDGLRERYGDDFEEFERVRGELDVLAHELHMLSDHSVQLDASFSKYGYSAHLRTRENHGDHQSRKSSTANSLSEQATLTDGQSSHSNSWEERNNGEQMRFFAKPIVRQYFHRGLLWRAQELAEVASYELFLDLFYVGIIAISGDGAAEEATGHALLKFVVTFIMGWKFWNDISQAAAWFDADDVLRRISILFEMACLLGFTTNIMASWDTTWTPLVAFYIAGRWWFALYYAWMAFMIPMVRTAMVAFALQAFLPAFVWIGSVYVENPNRLALIWVALVLDLFGNSITMTLFQSRKTFGKRYVKWADEHFEFMPALNIEHRIERTGAFVTLVFGYSVVALLYQSASGSAINGFFGKAVLGLIQAFSFNWLYFEMDSFNLHTHAIRRHFMSAVLWMYAHLPFIMGFVLASAALSKLVLAHDNSGTNPEHLYGAYKERSEEEISDGLRWYYCAGLSIALIGMSVISLCHVYKDIPNQRVSKVHRVASRIVVAIIILVLPFAKSLNSLDLISITTSLVVLSLIIEIWGASCVKDPFWQSRRHCTYAAKCHFSKKELAAQTKGGQVVNVQEIARKGKGELGIHSV